jgi:hypothetical protein
MTRWVEGERLDDACELFHNHAWETHKPWISGEQMSELLVVLRDWYRDEFTPKRTPVSREKKPKIVNKTGRVEPLIESSSTIPAKLRAAVLRRDDHSCQRCGRSLHGVRYGLQHRRPRQMGGSRRLHTMANLVALCGWSVDGGTCTAWVEVEDRPAATREGWLVPLGVDPEEWPVLRFGSSWAQPGDGWVSVEPHPRQIEDEAGLSGVEEERTG